MKSSWPNEEPAVLFKQLQTSESGLGALEASRRLQEDGANTLPEAPVDGPVAIFLHQFQSPLIYILLAAGGAILFLGETVDSIIIFAVLLFNAIVGTVQEGKAQDTLRALRRYVETSAVIIRDGVEMTVADSELVRGDLLVLREGERVPADARLIIANSLIDRDNLRLTERFDCLKILHERVAL